MLSRVGFAARAAAQGMPAIQGTQVRNMATLKELKLRLTSVQSIQKITKSMKMVSAAKFAKAERELKKGRPFGAAALELYQKAGLTGEIGESTPNVVYIAFSSDRGLCGAVHSSLVKWLKNNHKQIPAGVKPKYVIFGDKVKAVLPSNMRQDYLLTFNEVGKRPPTFSDACEVANALNDTEIEMNVGIILYNYFRSAIAYEQHTAPIYPAGAMETAPELSAYEVEGDALLSYTEFQTAATMFYTMLESTASEQSARMNAMDNATKNAGEMIEKLQITYNRTRQAVITTELIEIISGAAALE
eukprot:Clim_evm27s157 gene=Clim_evmTU27s157